MHRYEVMVILDPGLDDRTVKASIEKFLEVVTKDGGKVEDLAVWGRRHLSYPIKKHNEAIYVVINLDCKSETVLELDRQLRLNEAVLRTKVLRAEEAVFEIAQAELGAKTAAKTAAKPAAKAETKPAASKPQETPAPEPAAAKPAATKPAAKATASKPAAKPAAKATASKPAAKPAAKAPAKPAAKAPAKPRSPKGA